MSEHSPKNRRVVTESFVRKDREGDIIRILIIDDTEWIFELSQMFLELGNDANDSGFIFQDMDKILFNNESDSPIGPRQIECAETCAGAVTAFTKAMNESRPFHVVFVDADLDGPSTGTALAHRLRALDSRVLIVLTGVNASSASTLIHDQASWARRTLLLSKPIFPWEALHAALHAKALWDEDRAGVPTLASSAEETNDDVPNGLPIALARFDSEGRGVSANKMFLEAHPELAESWGRGLTLKEVRGVLPFKLPSEDCGTGSRDWRLVEYADGAIAALALVREKTGGYLLAEMDVDREVKRLCRRHRIESRNCAAERWARLVGELTGAAKTPSSLVELASERIDDLCSATLVGVMAPAPLRLGKALASILDDVHDRLGEVELCIGHRPWPALVDVDQFREAMTLLLLGFCESVEDPPEIEIETSNVRLDLATAESAGCAPGDYVAINFRIKGEGSGDLDVEDLFDPLGLTEADWQRRIGMLRSHAFARQSGGALDIECDVESDAMTVSILLPRARHVHSGKVRDVQSTTLNRCRDVA